MELAVNGLRHFHIPPFEGGLFDQPKDLIDDMFTWLAIEARLRYEKKEEGDSGDIAPPRTKQETPPLDDEIIVENIFK